MKKYLLSRPLMYYLLLSCLSGLLLAASWPPRHLGFLLFVSFIPLLYVLDNSKKLKQVFWCSFVAGFTWTLGTMYWEAGTASFGFAFQRVFYLIAFFYVALTISVPFLIWKKISPRLNKYIVWFSLPLIWTAYEFLNGKTDLAYTWQNLAFGLSYYPKFTGFSQIAGPHGVSFLIMSVNTLLYLMFKHRKEKPVLKEAGLSICIIFAGLLLADLFTGSTSNEEKRITKRIAIVQPNWKTFYIPDKKAYYDELDTLKKLMQPLAGQHLDLIVCPEGYFHHQSADTHPVIIDGIDNDTIVKLLKQLSLRAGAPILTGMELAQLYESHKPPTSSAKFISPGHYFDSYNGAVLISCDQPAQIYFKQILCPFTERCPFLNFFTRCHIPVNRWCNSFGLRNNPGVFTYKDMKIATGICWENSFPAYMASLVEKNDANMAVIVASDVSLGKVAAEIDAAYSIPLAVELQRSIVRCANSGISGTYDKNGVINNSSKWDEDKVIVQDIELNQEQSFFVKHGDLAGKFSFIASVLLLFFLISKGIVKGTGEKQNPVKNTRGVKTKVKNG